MSNQTTGTDPAVCFRPHEKTGLAVMAARRAVGDLSRGRHGTFNAFPDRLFPSMILVDADGWVDYANSSAAELLEMAEGADSSSGHPLAEHGRIPWLSDILTESSRDEDGVYRAEISLVLGGRLRIFDVRASKMDYVGLTYRRYAVVLEDITDRKDAEQFLKTERLEQTLTQTIDALVQMVEKRDPYTAGHQRRVAELAVSIGERLALDADRITGIRLGSVIHDIGKIYVPSEILNRPGRLTAGEFSLIKSHPEVGYEIMSKVEFPWPVHEIILQHHERLDGSGYPQGLKGEAITLEARIVAVADVVEAIHSHRPYRSAMGIKAALDEIRKGRGSMYDARVVDACVGLFSEGNWRWGEWAN